MAPLIPQRANVKADPSEMASRTSLARFVQGGVIPTMTNAVLSEFWSAPLRVDRLPPVHPKGCTPNRNQ